ncbi:NAD(P)/FAD-dependent oxidoreductase [Urechidicola croceus]|uniref:NADH:ubiquinone reductase (non-electrogenic) n=1 Tax=Urechidicola croceus TaxID=1850246 RepID=A0A1D8P5E7_9FLAO|nr:NAD(P)/FAD-dependent oxidoreductase [Urechidicola croceus]AOW19798.1 FAD-dependent oxidoreductase [Urechidicola croceus]
MAEKQKIIIIGAGFGGLSLAKSFKNKNVDVLLIDQYNYHNFQPLMYQVATGGLEPYSIAYPVRRVFRGFKNVRFRMAKVNFVDTSMKTVNTSIGNFPFDHLIIATGSETNFFNFEPTKDNLLTLKSIPDALNLRSFIFQNLEKALIKQKEEELDEILSIAIVGGGPAGLEIAGALAEMKTHVIPKDFPDLDISKMSINLYQSSSRLVKTMSEEASAKSLEYLQKLGVNVYLNSRVVSYENDDLILKDGTVFETDTVIWTAGVKGAPIEGLPKESIIGGNRISVNEYNQVINVESVYAIGDVAACISKENPRGLPMLAPVAQKQGKLLAKNILRIIDNKPLEPFVYKDRGVMATIGRRRAVVDLPKWKFQGTFAWLVWMFVHIMSLVGYRNKVVAFMDWLANYFTYDKPLGLIIRPFNRK